MRKMKSVTINIEHLLVLINYKHITHKNKNRYIPCLSSSSYTSTLYSPLWALLPSSLWSSSYSLLLHLDKSSASCIYKPPLAVDQLLVCFLASSWYASADCRVTVFIWVPQCWWDAVLLQVPEYWWVVFLLQVSFTIDSSRLWHQAQSGHFLSQLIKFLAAPCNFECWR